MENFIHDIQSKIKRTQFQFKFKKQFKIENSQKIEIGIAQNSKDYDNCLDLILKENKIKANESNENECCYDFLKYLTLCSTKLVFVKNENQIIAAVILIKKTKFGLPFFSQHPEYESYFSDCIAELSNFTICSKAEHKELLISLLIRFISEFCFKYLEVNYLITKSDFSENSYLKLFRFKKAENLNKTSNTVNAMVLSLEELFYYLNPKIHFLEKLFNQSNFLNVLYKKKDIMFSWPVKSNIMSFNLLQQKEIIKIITQKNYYFTNNLLLNSSESKLISDLKLAKYIHIKGIALNIYQFETGIKQEIRIYIYSARNSTYNIN